MLAYTNEFVDSVVLLLPLSLVYALSLFLHWKFDCSVNRWWFSVSFWFCFYFFFGFVSFRRQMIPLWLCLYVHKLWYDNHYFKSSPINMKNIVIYLSTNAHIHAHTNNVLLVSLSFRQSLVYRVLAKWFGSKPICTMTILKTISCAYRNNLSFIHAHIIMDFSLFFSFSWRK